MAGGMGPPERRPGMGPPERSARAGIGTIGEQARHQRAGTRHALVIGPPDDPGPHQGLVLAWQQGTAGWTAWVVYVLAGDDPLVVQAWVPAAHLRPVAG